jgi:hypothetical protein
MKHAINSGFTRGYRSREEPSTLKPDVMIPGSQNVVTTVRHTVATRAGYSLDGQASSHDYPVTSSYDWDRHTGDERNVRANSNGLLQYRLVGFGGGVTVSGHSVADGEAYWVDLATGFGPLVSYSPFWEATNELKQLLLFVDGTSNVFMWSGGVARVKATTVSTIQATFPVGTTWASSGFLSSATYARQVVINGNTYAYTGGEGTDTLTGVTPDPSGEAIGSIAHQKVVTTANSAITALSASFKNSIITVMRNQVYVSGQNSNQVYVSKASTFLDFGFTPTARLVGEGALLTFDGVPTAMYQHGETLQVSAGKKWWYEVKFELSSDNAKEAMTIAPRKASGLIASISQKATTKLKNQIAFLSFEKQVNRYGIKANYYADPQTDDLSASIVNDLSASDTTGASLIQWRKFLFVALPVEGLVYIYNMTADQTEGLSDDASHYWEAPQVLPISCFSIIGGEIYGHSLSRTETYRLFTGNTDNGAPISAKAVFAYNAYGDRTQTKSSNELFIEGYKTQSTRLTPSFCRGIGSASTSLDALSVLPDRNITVVDDDSSVGKSPLGKTPVGGSLAMASVKPKFRAILTYARVPFFEESVAFESNGEAQEWEIVSFGTNATLTTEGQNSIKDPNATL